MPDYSKPYRNMTPAELLIEWIKTNKEFFNITDRTKLILNIKGKSIIPEVVLYPKPLKQLDKSK